ncbi:4-hydroxythreonine-4-phosphate dehydrogenase PdxA [Haladaptatus sp. DYF46]|uniref:4-hydroxythreonine-4-phosphate dehydrogenase PdxA n=1 Tax=Haladaptatus sp. DYF46 TaxID=2886041 RepID=UPI001E47C98E|nr:4-hydroxythreonine-4-phosphate dehydrogenase PdxA [Haladaptatus sp. DYF46]
MDGKPLLAVTMGDPAGIGAEVIAGAYDTGRETADLLAVGDAAVVEKAVEITDIDVDVRAVSDVADARFEAGTLDVLDLNRIEDHEWGDLREEYGTASLAYVERAIDLAVDGDVDGIVTAPIHKQATRMAGSEHAGHTGLLASRTGVEDYSMMLVEGDLRVTHVSTHVPLREACDLVTTENVLDTVRVTREGLLDLGLSEPRIAVAGLNPHASDGGLLGDEERSEIEPAVGEAREEGIDVEGPESPDTVYVQAARGAYDCVVSMYHDEGHIPIKMLGFSEGGEVSGVNMTVGLPIIRTSVDHGTAFDIAGEGIASPRSMEDAIEVATTAVRNRRARGAHGV